MPRRRASKYDKEMKKSVLIQLLFLLLFRVCPASSKNSAIATSREEDLTCPTWTDRTAVDSECKCGSSFKGRVVCDPDNLRVYLYYCYCMSYDLKLNRSVVGPCIYNCIDRVFWGENSEESSVVKKISSYNLLPQNKSELIDMCSYFHRAGRLCGDCQEGFSPSVFTYTLECINCTLTWRSITGHVVLYIFLPHTAFYILALLFRLRITAPKFTAFILVSQVIGSQAFIKLVLYNSRFKMVPGLAQTAIKIIIQFYSTWNLDFFKYSLDSFCIPGIDTKSAMALELIPASYPLLLVFLTVCLAELHNRGNLLVTTLWSPFYAVLRKIRREWDVSDSLNSILGTMLILSYYKILATTLDLLTIGYARDLNGKVLGLWNFYQASAHTNKASVIYLVVLVLIVVMVPCLTLLLYPLKPFRTHFMEKYIFKSDRSRLALKMFMDSLQGYYKDGTEPRSRDHRYMAGLYLLLRLIIYVEFIWTLYSNFVPIIVTTLMAFAFLILITKPYNAKYSIYNVVEPLLLGNLILLFLAMQGAIAALHEKELFGFYMTVCVLILLVPPGYFVSVLVHFIVKSKHARKLRLLLLKKLAAAKHKRQHEVKGCQRQLSGKARKTTYSTIDITRDSSIEVQGLA